MAHTHTHTHTHTSIGASTASVVTPPDSPRCRASTAGTDTVSTQSPRDESWCLAGKVAFVVGGTRGLGFGMAAAMAAAGATVVVGSRDAQRVAEAAALLGQPHSGVVIDVAEPASVAEAFRQVQALHGDRLDILVNAAGIVNRANAEEESLADFDRVMRINVLGAFHCCQRAFPMLCRAAGCIINIGSLCSHVAYSNVTSYGVSKAALTQLSRGLANDWGRFHVRVNTLTPGNFPTDMNRKELLETARGRWKADHTPLGRFGASGDLDGAIVFLASDASRFVTGAELTVDGGFLARGVGPELSNL